ncbi:Caffeoylshikimate esterase [Linum perenne]
MAREAEGVRFDEEFILNSRGMKLFTCKWLPIGQEPKALIFLCHGYAMESSITMDSTAIRLAKQGFGIYGIDYEGHGKSAGLQGYIDNFDFVVDDCSKHFISICEEKENRGKRRYLMGESMGGAVTLLLHRKLPNFWDGAVLVAPMCKIADDVKPPQMVISALTKLSRVIPTWRIVPTKDIIDTAFKVPEIRKQIRENPLCYKGRPRLKTAFELLRISIDIEQRLSEVTMPFLLLHGQDDRVTEKSISKQLFDVASSRDKTIKLYDGMWHGLLYGELPENIDIVFKDITEWLDQRSDCSNQEFEMEQKLDNDYNMFK